VLAALLLTIVGVQREDVIEDFTKSEVGIQGVRDEVRDYMVSTGMWHGVADGHGLLEISLGPAMPYPSTPCRRPPLKLSYGRFRGDHLQSRRPAAVFYPIGHPTPLMVSLRTERT
jgi:hypothetical protein